MTLIARHRRFICLSALFELCCGPPIDHWTKDHPLANAAVRSDIQRLNRLISAGASVNDVDGNGWTALHWAACEFAQWGNRENQSACIRLLIAHGANVNARTKGGNTPLEFGSWSGDCVHVLLSAGALPNVADASGETPLREAAGSDSLDAVKLLVDAGAEVNAQDKSGWTPLMAAVIHGTPDIVSVLLRAGANVNARDTTGGTALKQLRALRLPGLFEQLINSSERRYVRERHEIEQILYAAGATE